MVSQPRRLMAAFFFAGSVLFIAVMTLRPLELAPSPLPICVFCGTLGGVDFLLNVALFVPLGASLRWLTGSWKTSVIAGTVFTLVIELLQVSYVTGRDASLGDLLANSLGTLVGAWIAVAGIGWLNASAIRARRITVACAALAMAVLGSSAWLLQPAQTRWPQWVDWTPHRAGTDLFRGHLVSVDVNGIAVDARETLRPPRTLDAATQSLTVRAVVDGPVPPTQKPAVIIRIAHPLEEGFSFVQRGEAVEFQANALATRVKFRTPVVRFSDAFSATHGSLTLEGQSTPRFMVIRRISDDGESSVTIRRTIGLGWTLLAPWEIGLNPDWWPANAGWLAALILPVMCATRRTARKAPDESRGRLLWWPLALVLAALVVIPVAVGLSGLAVGEWLGVLAGAAGGVALEALTAPSAQPA